MTDKVPLLFPSRYDSFNYYSSLTSINRCIATAFKVFLPIYEKSFYFCSNIVQKLIKGFIFE